jgi:CBS domain-containing protein
MHAAGSSNLTESGSALKLQVRALLVRPPVTCEPDATIADASRAMVERGVGSIIVVGPGGEPLGIVTDRDLRGRVLAVSRSVSDPVASIMSTPVAHVSGEAFVFEALLEMTRRNIHHLAVLEAGKLIGVVSGHDLLLLQAAAPLEVARLIESQTSLVELTAVMPKLTEAARRLFEQGVTGYQTGRIVTELNDLVIRRVLAISEAELRGAGFGEPPLPFCWLALGSEGRREQTLRTDQDNGLVYQDPASPAARRSAERYFPALAERAIEQLVELGYPRCPGDSMASNPRWCQPLSVWRGYFAEWARDTTPENLIHASIYLDFRPVAGTTRLAEEMREEVRAQVNAWRSFPRYLGKIAVSHAPPLGLFGRFKLQRQGGRRGINVKLGGMLILNNALRAYAIDLGLDETNTIERLEAAARTAGCFTPDEVEDIREAYETVFHVRLRHQLQRLADGQKADNLIDPATLTVGEQRRLRQAFRAIRRLQGKVEDRYLTQAI